MALDTNQNKHTTYDDNANKIAEVRKLMDDASKREWEKWKAANPGLAEKFGYKTQNLCYRRRPSGFSKVIPRIVELMLQNRGESARKTQKEILATIQKELPLLNILPNIWTKPFQRWERDKVQLKVKDVMNTSITGCKTLSSVRKLIVATLDARSAKRVFKRPVAITENAVLVGKKTYTIEIHSSGKHQYSSIRVGKKRNWLKIELLREFLETQ